MTLGVELSTAWMLGAGEAGSLVVEAMKGMAIAEQQWLVLMWEEEGS